MKKWSLLPTLTRFSAKAQDVVTMWLVSLECYSKPHSCRLNLKRLFHSMNPKQMQQDPQNFSHESI